MNLNLPGVPDVAGCRNTVTAEQAETLAALTRTFCGDMVTVMFDREGENGANQAILALADRCRVRCSWTRHECDDFSGIDSRTSSKTVSGTTFFGPSCRG